MNKIIKYFTALALAMTMVPAITHAQTIAYKLGMPTFLPFPSGTVEWQRDIYREVKMNHEQNIGLFYGCEGKHLFTRLLSLVVSGKVKSYAYRDNGSISDIPNTEKDLMRLLKDYHIRYTERKGRLVVDTMDIPYDMISGYYLKESVFYDTTNSMFRTQVIALCPILEEEDDYESEKLRYPLFWVNYKDIEPYIQDLRIIPDSRNIYSQLPIVDYFTRNMYRGEIYKVFTPADISLPQYCKDPESMGREQNRIEQELVDVRKQTYNTFHKQK